MVVEDESAIRKNIVQDTPWQDHGITVCGEAGNGSAALGMLDQLCPDIMLLDIQMPVMDGIETLKEMETRQSMPGVIVLSSYSEFSYVQQAMRYGALDYLLKPFRPSDLVEAVLRVNARMAASQGASKESAIALEKLAVKNDNYVIKRAVHYIEQIYHRDIKLEEIARHVYVTPAYLSTRFKQETGISTKNYLHKLRIEEACKLLSTPAIRVYEVAERVGYTEEKYFFQVFKKYMHLTPMQYRKQKGLD